MSQILGNNNITRDTEFTKLLISLHIMSRFYESQNWSKSLRDEYTLAINHNRNKKTEF